MDRRSIKVKRLFWVVFIVVSILAVIIPVRYPTTGQELTVVENRLFNFFPFIPVVALILTYYLRRFPNFKPLQFLNTLSNVTFLNLAGIILMPIFLISTYIGIPGLWWSWSTLAIHTGAIIALGNLLSNKLKPATALLASISIIALGAAVWEIMYHTGIAIAYYHYTAGVVFVVAFLTPQWSGGAATIVATRLKPNFNKLTITFGLIFLTSIVVWWITGYGQDLLYDAATKTVYHSAEYRWMDYSLWKGSKLFLNLMLISMFGCSS